MARLKPNLGKIENLDQANLTLKDIGLWQQALDVIDGRAHKEIAEIKTKAANDGQELRDQIKAASERLGAYAEYNRDELFKDRKSVRLAFGNFGFRQSTSISIKKTTLELLRKMKLSKCIMVKEEPSKDAMAALDDETLAQVDAVRKIKDDFFCEADREEINKDILKGQLA